jgi:hypothetical protein
MGIGCRCTIPGMVGVARSWLSCQIRKNDTKIKGLSPGNRAICLRCIISGRFDIHMKRERTQVLP